MQVPRSIPCFGEIKTVCLGVAVKDLPVKVHPSLMMHSVDSTGLLANKQPKTLFIYAGSIKTAHDFVEQFEQLVKNHITEKVMKYETHSDDYQDQVRTGWLPCWFTYLGRTKN